MNRRWPRLALYVLGAIAVASVIWQIWQVPGIMRRSNDVMDRVLQELDSMKPKKRGAAMQTITTTVTDTQGNEHTITTERNDGEAVADWLARHMEAVNAAKNL